MVLEVTSTVPSLLEISHLTVAFPAGLALDDVSFTMNRDRLHAILGEDGAGKTTLAKVLCGAIPAEKISGQIMLDGMPLVLRSLADGVHHGIAIVPSKISVFDHMSVADNVLVASWQQKRRFALSRRSSESQAEELLAHWGIDLELGASVRGMSAVQQRLLMIARALGAEPKLLILDEPLRGILGQHPASQLLLAIRRIADRGASCLYLARKPAEAMQIAQVVTVLRDGTIAGSWERAKFDEAELAAAMASQQLGGARAPRPDDDFAEPAGPLGALRQSLERWMRPGS